MKAAELFKVWKPKKPKKVKLPDPFFFGWGGGWSSEIPGDGGGISEDIDSEFEERRATNFGFHPSRRQFWFRIVDMDLFMKGQTEWLANGRRPDKKPNSSYVDWLINNEIMVLRDGKAWRENLAVVLGWGALRGNRPATDQMVFMFDPKQAVPSTKKMREFGLQADFTYDGEPHEAR